MSGCSGRVVANSCLHNGEQFVGLCICIYIYICKGDQKQSFDLNDTNINKIVTILLSFSHTREYLCVRLNFVHIMYSFTEMIAYYVSVVFCCRRWHSVPADSNRNPGDGDAWGVQCTSTWLHKHRLHPPVCSYFM